MASPPTAYAAPPGWRLAWSDDFDRLDTEHWEIVTSNQPTNNSRQAYLSSQVSVQGGKLIITSDDTPAGDLPFRSGQVITRTAQRLGRWEVRAKLPTTQGLWPAIWLLPDVNEHRWPSGGEIDIMENRGDQPTITSSAFHYGSANPFEHDFLSGGQQTYFAERLVDYSKRFHVFAAEWSDRHIRFFVDDVHHFTVYDEEVEGFLSEKAAPMELVINTAVGGNFLPDPDSTTKFPQRLEVDWVRVYKPTTKPPKTSLTNGGFESNGGTLAGWSVFGSKLHDNPNVVAAQGFAFDGLSSLKLFGSFGSGGPYSGVSQGVTAEPGRSVRVDLRVLSPASDSIAGTQNAAIAKLEFYSEFGAKNGGPAMLSEKEVVIADGSSTANRWNPATLTATVPQKAVEARLAIVFHQPNQEPGAVYVDDIKLRVVKRP